LLPVFEEASGGPSSGSVASQPPCLPPLPGFAWQRGRPFASGPSVVHQHVDLVTGELPSDGQPDTSVRAGDECSACYVHRPTVPFLQGNASSAMLLLELVELMGSNP
jgi:hypothetical protein